jgi:hypothetical protein
MNGDAGGMSLGPIKVPIASSELALGQNAMPLSNVKRAGPEAVAEAVGSVAVGGIARSDRIGRWDGLLELGWQLLGELLIPGEGCQ